MRIAGVLYFFVIIVIFACRQQNHTRSSDPKLAKAIPANYILTTDTNIRLIRDTMFWLNEYFTGFLIGLYPSGDTSSNEGFFNGVREGKQLRWSESGVLISSQYYINGKKEGLQRAWWEDGKPQLRYRTSNNEYEGEFLEWNRSGVLIKKFQYARGQEVGPQRLWWDNGTVRANYVIKDGRKYGLIGLKLCANPNDSLR